MLDDLFAPAVDFHCISPSYEFEVVGRHTIGWDKNDPAQAYDLGVRSQRYTSKRGPRERI